MTQPADRILITKVERTSETRADLIGKGHQFRDAILFDLAELETVGIVDYARLPIGQQVPVRFWCYYTESEKTTSKGNPYKDVLYLEPVGDVKPTAPAGDLGPVVDLLTTISAQLDTLIQQNAQLLGQSPGRPTPQEPPQGPPPLETEPPHQLDTDPEAGTPQASADPPVHRDLDGSAPMNDAEARRLFQSMVGPAIAAGHIPHTKATELSQDAKVKGWRDAWATLDQLVQQATASP